MVETEKAIEPIVKMILDGDPLVIPKLEPDKITHLGFDCKIETSTMYISGGVQL